MADTIALTFDTPKAQRIGGIGAFGMVSGLATLSSYATSKSELTALTGMFVPSTGLLRVVCDGTSSGGYSTRWDATSKAFRAYRAGTATASLALSAAGAGSTITLGASPATYTNADALPQDIVLTGGTVSDVKIVRGGYTSATLFTATNIIVHLEVGDSMIVTYSGAPSVQEKLPRAAYALTNSAAAVLVEGLVGANIGTFNFLAFGQIAG